MTLKDNRPVVLLDIGGMFGMSWRVLASQYSSQVKTGKIAFVISSLSNYLSNFKYERLTRQERDFLDRTENLVQSIDANPSQLRKKQISLPNGIEIPLENNTDIVHESMSMTAWSMTPDIDIMRVPRLLSPYGIYLVPFEDVEHQQISSYFDEERKMIIREGISLAHAQLQSRYGLVRLEKIEEGDMEGEYMNYIVFKKENAPAISINKWNGPHMSSI